MPLSGHQPTNGREKQKKTFEEMGNMNSVGAPTAFVWLGFIKFLCWYKKTQQCLHCPPTLGTLTKIPLNPIVSLALLEIRLLVGHKNYTWGCRSQASLLH